MSDGALTVLDGTHLAALHVTLPESDTALTGAQVLDLADSAVSSSLFALSPPQTLRSSALQRINIPNDDVFRRTELAPQQASQTIKLYIAAIADVLNADDPIAVAILDGKTISIYLEDEDDFAMIAENLFTELDAEDKGKIKKSEIQNALVHMGVEMGVPPISDFPQLNSILKKHGADGEEELGQGQFALLLQNVLQELAEALAEKHCVLIQNIKIGNGSKLRKLLADVKQVNNVIEKILQEKNGEKHSSRIVELVRSFLEKSGLEFGLPPSEANEGVALLYNLVFSDTENKKTASEVDRDELFVTVKEILEKFAELLEASPVYYDLGN
ncbi:Parvalbumin [Parasponia andersonii]|uniref:Parvalbumin n=1 Tax=Parasponia andersonii TaxID=3476 RepID=A0A2P5DKK7_PARAD|nr:Parvalbumin [Parasponia andersonii]